MLASSFGHCIARNEAQRTKSWLDVYSQTYEGSPEDYWNQLVWRGSWRGIDYVTNRVKDRPQETEQEKMDLSRNERFRLRIKKNIGLGKVTKLMDQIAHRSCRIHHEVLKSLDKQFAWDSLAQDVFGPRWRLDSVTSGKTKDHSKKSPPEGPYGFWPIRISLINKVRSLKIMQGPEIKSKHPL